MTPDQFKQLCALARGCAKEAGAKGKDARKLRNVLVKQTIDQIKRELANGYRPADAV